MQTIADKWLKELPQQFQCKKNIEVFIEALAKQMQEILDVIQDLENIDINTATGINLDYVGSIVALTRKEAAAMMGNNDFDMDDETYRLYLKYKVLLNTSECTYYELMEGLSMLFDVENVKYEENPEYPATIILNMPVENNYIRIGSVPMIKSAGVRIIWRYKVENTMDMYVGCTYQQLKKQIVAPVAEDIENEFNTKSYCGLILWQRKSVIHRCEVITPTAMIKVYDSYDAAIADEDGVAINTVGVYIED